MGSYRHLNKEMYYSIIKNWALKNGRSPTKEDFNEDIELPSPRTLEERLKIPWNKALKELGLQQIKDKTYYLLMEEKELLEEFKKEYIRLNYPTRKEFGKNRKKNFPSLNYLEKKLGKWNHILNKCKFDIKKETCKTKDDYKKLILELTERLKRTPRIIDIEKDICSIDVILNSFEVKKYNDLLDILELERNRTLEKNCYTREDLKIIYIDFSNKLGYPARSEDLNKSKDLPSYNNFYAREFGDIKTLREECGYYNIKYRINKYSKEQVKNILLTLYKKYSRKLTTGELMKEIKDKKYPSLTTMFRKLEVGNINSLWKEVLKSN